jgi:hypothetical protein
LQAEFPMTPEELIDSLDTAVVEVYGDIPAGAQKGRMFDIYVNAASFDPDTQSLAGGFLLTTDLKVSRDNSPQSAMEGRTLAKARGPVFMNPFARPGKSPGGPDLRGGAILAGGVSTEDREIALVTTTESYATVRQIQNAINTTFNAKPPVADANTPSRVKLHIPADYRGRERRFFEIVMHLSIASSAQAKEARCKLLAAELVRPDSPLDGVALALEGIGPTAKPRLRDLYTHQRRDVSYYAARTGLRLGDPLALEVVARHAKDEKSPFRAQAIHELGDCGHSGAAIEEGGRGTAIRAGVVLRELMTSTDPRIRVMAYEALRRVEPESVTTWMAGKDPENFIIDVVPSDGPAMVYARRNGTRRVALIGGDHLELHPPFLYAEPGKPILVSATQNDKQVSVLKKDQKGRTILGPLHVGTSLSRFVYFMGNDPEPDVYGEVQGLGMDYSVVLDVLYRLCEKGAVPATFKWEEPGLEDIYGPLKPKGRPESEL